MIKMWIQVKIPQDISTYLTEMITISKIWGKVGDNSTDKSKVNIIIILSINYVALI